MTCFYMSTNGMNGRRLRYPSSEAIGKLQRGGRVKSTKLQNAVTPRIIRVECTEKCCVPTTDSTFVSRSFCLLLNSFATFLDSVSPPVTVEWLQNLGKGSSNSAPNGLAATDKLLSPQNLHAGN